MMMIAIFIVNRDYHDGCDDDDYVAKGGQEGDCAAWQNLNKISNQFLLLLGKYINIKPLYPKLAISE